MADTTGPEYMHLKDIPPHLRSSRLLIESIRRLRHYACGFGARDGYDIRKIKAKGKSAISKYRMSELLRYDAQLDELLSRANIYVRTRKRQRLRALQEYSGMPKFMPKFKGALLPLNPAYPAKIYWKGDKIKKIVQLGVVRNYYAFDQEALAIDPHSEFEKAAQFLESDLYMINCGEHLIYNAYERCAAEEELVKLTKKYSSENFDESDPNSKFYGNWLIGITGFNIPDSESYFESVRKFSPFLSAWNAERNELSSIRKKSTKRTKLQIATDKANLIGKINAKRKLAGLSPLKPSEPQIFNKNKKNK